MAHGAETSVLSKRVLVELSHAIEQFALAAEPGTPLVVIALFQKLSYFERETTVYSKIAQRGAVTLVGLAEDFPPALPEGVHHTLFAEQDELAKEWSVTVLGPGGGATLVALDLESVEADAPTLERGRQFRGHWSFRRDAAYQEVLRLRSQLRLPPSTVAEIDAVLHAVVVTPQLPQPRWWDVPVRFLVDRMEGAIRGRDRASTQLDTAQPGSAHRDPRTGLLNTNYLQRWTTGLGEGTLPIGLVVLRLLDLDVIRRDYSMRIELATVATIARILEELVSTSDRVIRIDRSDLLVVLPGWARDSVHDFSREACLRVATLDQQYPFVTLTAVAAATVTRRRPLPLGQLLDEVAHSSRATDNVRMLAS